MRGAIHNRSLRECGPQVFFPVVFKVFPFTLRGTRSLHQEPAGVSVEQQEQLVQSINRLDQLGNKTWNNPEVDSRIAAYEMAFRMQASVPSLVDMSDESQKTLEAYGAKPVTVRSLPTAC